MYLYNLLVHVGMHMFNWIGEQVEDMSDQINMMTLQTSHVENGR